MLLKSSRVLFFFSWCFNDWHLRPIESKMKKKKKYNHFTNLIKFSSNIEIFIIFLFKCVWKTMMTINWCIIQRLETRDISSCAVKLLVNMAIRKYESFKTHFSTHFVAISPKVVNEKRNWKQNATELKTI